MSEGNPKHYSEEEAEEILKLAVSRSASGGVSRERLLQTAGELGVSPEALAQAEAEWRDRRERMREEEEFDREHRRSLVKHISSFLIVNAFLFMINMLTPGPWWFLWPLLGWGLGLAFHVAHDFLRKGAHSEEFEAWRRAKRRREEFSRRRAAAGESAEQHIAGLIERSVREQLASASLAKERQTLADLQHQAGMSAEEAKSALEDWEQANPNRILH